MRMDIPVDAASVFRILAIRQVVEFPELQNYLANNIVKLINGIETTQRLTDAEKYRDFLNYSSSHKGQSCFEDIEKMDEVKLCSAKEAFFRDGCGDIGDVIDYQVPLRSSKNSGEGVADLLSVNGDKIFLIEAKRWNSKESPIRAMLEVLTFWKMLLDDKVSFERPNCGLFVKRYNESNKDRRKRDLPEESILYPAILIRKGSNIYEKLKNMSKEEASFYKVVLTEFKLRCFCYYYEKGLVTKDFTSEIRKCLHC